MLVTREVVVAGDEMRRGRQSAADSGKVKVTPNTGRIRRERRAAILAAAESEFSINGYKGTSTSMIAKAAGLAKAQLHYYFPNKDDLYYELLANIADQWSCPLADVTADDDPAVVLRTYIGRKMRTSWERPALSKIFAGEVLRGGPMLKSQFSEQRKWLDHISDVIRCWIALGKMDRVEPDHFVFMIWAVTQHYANCQAQVLELTGRSYLDEADLSMVTEQVVRVVFKGCGIRY
ncbi:MAG: TetR/AcrR family transcriptional regulator [Motiliproteus sp.]